MKDFFLLGVGMNLFYHKNSFSLRNNKTGVNLENSDADYFSSDAKKKGSLIGGVLSPKTVRTYFSVNETELYKNWGRTWTATFE